MLEVYYSKKAAKPLLTKDAKQRATPNPAELRTLQRSSPPGYHCKNGFTALKLLPFYSSFLLALKIALVTL